MNLKLFELCCVVYCYKTLFVSPFVHCDPHRKQQCKCETTEMSPTWVPASNGIVPDFAVQGGEDMDGILYVARAYHSNEIIPGKLKPSNGVTYVGIFWMEYPKSEYEVLIGCKPKWVQVNGDDIPEDSFEAGKSYDGPYYVCRVPHEGTITNGKMHLSHSRCYIPYEVTEFEYDSYEILSCQN